MKKIFLIALTVLAISVRAQITTYSVTLVKSLPTISTIVGADFVIVDKAAGGTRKINLNNFVGAFYIPIGSGTSNYGAKWQTGTTLTNSVLYDDGTNLGLGTTTPSSIFHIKSGSPTITFESTTNTITATFIPYGGSTQTELNTNAGGFQFSSLSGYMHLNTIGTSTVVTFYPNSNVGSLKFTADNTSANNQLFLASNFNVGIGTAVPTSLFSVAELFKIDGSGNITKTNGIIGTATNDDAVAGYRGEYIGRSVAIGSAGALTTTTTTTITSISLTAGDWMVSGNVNFSETLSTVTARSGGITSTALTIPVDGSEGNCGVQSTVTSEKNSIVLQPKRISIASTTVVYLLANATFSAGTCSGYGTINAWRVR